MMNERPVTSGDDPTLRVRHLEESLGPHHPDTLAATSDLADYFISERDYTQAEQTLASLVESRRSANGKYVDTPEIAARQKYGFVLSELGKDQKARDIEEPLLYMCVESYGAGGINTLFVWRNLSSILLRLGDRERFLTVGKDILPAQLARPVGLPERELLAIYVLGLCYKRAEAPGAASEIFRRVIRECFSGRHCFVVLCRSMMIVWLQIPMRRLVTRRSLPRSEQTASASDG